MEAQLNELIEKIKSEGVEAADQKAAEIIAEANTKAEQIVDEARLKAQSIIDEAKAERTKTEAAGMEALTQAGRDLLLSLESKITEVFRSVIDNRVAASLDESTIREAVITVVKGWATEKAGTMDLLLGDELATKLESALKSDLADQFAAGMEIKPVRGVAAGFRIGTKDGAAYYDFTAAAIAEAMSAFLGPKLQTALKAAVE